MSNSQSDRKRNGYKRRKQHSLPWIVRWLRISFTALESISPPIAARWAYKLWFTSPRYPEPQREKRWREQAQCITVEQPCGPIAVYRWGQGPAVLLVHGWSGRGTQMAAFASPLVEAGFSVVAFDAPGHGRSPGTNTNLLEVAKTLQAVAHQETAVKAIVAHSFGTMVTNYAISQGLSTEKVVCISSPTSPVFLLDSFRDSLKIGPKTERLFRAKFEVDFGADIWERVSSENLAKAFTVPALIIHDKDDADVPCSWGERLAKAWPGAHLWLTEGLGHRRILRNSDVVHAVAGYIKSNQLPEER